MIQTQGAVAQMDDTGETIGNIHTVELWLCKNNKAITHMNKYIFGAVIFEVIGGPHSGNS